MCKKPRRGKFDNTGTGISGLTEVQEIQNWSFISFA